MSSRRLRGGVSDVLHLSGGVSRRRRPYTNTNSLLVSTSMLVSEAPDVPISTLPPPINLTVTVRKRGVYP
jgi:hypothetical protein